MNILFIVPRVHPGINCIKLTSLLISSAPFSWSLLFFFLIIIDSFEKYWSDIFWNASKFGLVRCFSHDCNGIVGLGEENHRIELPLSSHHFKGLINILSIRLITGNENVGHLARVMS